MSCLVVVKKDDGTLALRTDVMFEHQHMLRGELGVTLGESAEEAWFVKVLFPPGIVYDVVREHLDFLSEEKDS